MNNWIFLKPKLSHHQDFIVVFFSIKWKNFLWTRTYFFSRSSLPSLDWARKVKTYSVVFFSLSFLLTDQTNKIFPTTFLAFLFSIFVPEKNLPFFRPAGFACVVFKALSLGHPVWWCGCTHKSLCVTLLMTK